MDKTRYNTTSIKHHVIIVPGLGNSYWFYKWATRHWYKKNITVHFLPLAWEKGTFAPKLKELIKCIDTLALSGNVSLIGTSAGGSAVINAYALRKKKVKNVINICGRLRKGEHVFPSLVLAAHGNPAFTESVLLCEENIQTLNSSDKKKILTVRGLFDELVPVSTTSIEGANNVNVPSIGHMPSIAIAITLFSRRIIAFLIED